MTKEELIFNIATDISNLGGRIYYVGGCVRDKIINIPIKDIDIEIHNINVDDALNVLSKYGKVLSFGKSFGIYNIKGYDIDFAFPRSEIKTGVLHTDFDVSVDPFIGTYKSSIRRDFTMNSILEDCLTHELIDHFNGIIDINNKVIRHINNDSFSEDPLRVLRACQFASRFGFTIDNNTIELCKNISLKDISKERIEGELKKALLKSNKPSLFFDNLLKMNQLDKLFKDVYDLIGVKQNPIYHPEGDCYIHTMAVLDCGHLYIERVEHPYEFMLSCLCHDFGKVCTSGEIDGVIHSYEHELYSASLAKDFIKTITNNNYVKSYVSNMCLLHMKPNIYSHDKSRILKTNIMFDSSICPNDLIYLSICDRLGSSKDNDYEDFLFDRLSIYISYMNNDYITGKDLIDMGITNKNYFKKILDEVHHMRLCGQNKKVQYNYILKNYKNIICLK